MAFRLPDLEPPPEEGEAPKGGEAPDGDPPRSESVSRAEQPLASWAPPPDRAAARPFGRGEPLRQSPRGVLLPAGPAGKILPATVSQPTSSAPAIDPRPALDALLVRRGIATAREMSEAIARCELHGGDLTTSLLQFVNADEAQLSAALSDCYALPSARVGLLPVVDPAVRAKVPREVAERYCCYPLQGTERHLVLAVAEPLDPGVREELAFALGVRIDQHVALEVRIRQAIARDYGASLSQRDQRGISRLEGDLRGTSQHIPSGLWPVATLSSLPQPPTDPLRPRSPTPPPARLRPGRGSRPAQRRRRGPISAARARQELREAKSRDEVLSAFFDFAAQFFEYSALFGVHNSLAEGLEARGPGASKETVVGIGVPLDLPSSLAAVARTGAPRFAPLGADGLDAGLLEDLKRPGNGLALLLPVHVRGRCVLILYADSGECDPLTADTEEVSKITSDVAAALERIILHRKRVSLAAASRASTTPPPAEHTPRRTPPASPPPPAAAGQPAPPTQPPSVPVGSPTTPDIHQAQTRLAPLQNESLRLATIPSVAPTGGPETPPASEPSAVVGHRLVSIDPPPPSAVVNPTRDVLGDASVGNGALAEGVGDALPDPAEPPGSAPPPNAAATTERSAAEVSDAPVGPANADLQSPEAEAPPEAAALPRSEALPFAPRRERDASQPPATQASAAPPPLEEDAALRERRRASASVEPADDPDDDMNAAGLPGDPVFLLDRAKPSSAPPRSVVVASVSYPPPRRHNERLPSVIVRDGEDEPSSPPAPDTSTASDVSRGDRAIAAPTGEVDIEIIVDGGTGSPGAAEEDGLDIEVTIDRTPSPGRNLGAGRPPGVSAPAEGEIPQAIGPAAPTAPDAPPPSAGDAAIQQARAGERATPADRRNAEGGESVSTGAAESGSPRPIESGPAGRGAPPVESAHPTSAAGEPASIQPAPLQPASSLAASDDAAPDETPSDEASSSDGSSSEPPSADASPFHGAGAPSDGELEAPESRPPRSASTPPSARELLAMSADLIPFTLRSVPPQPAVPKEAAPVPAGAASAAEASVPRDAPPEPTEPLSEVSGLVERLCQGDLEAGQHLTRLGGAGVAALMTRFPGPVVTERAGPNSRASECGPLLSALANIGSPAAADITTFSSSEDDHVRRWATLLLGELPSPEACRAVVRRLGDEAPRVHQAALDAARLLLRSSSAALFRQALFEVAESDETPTNLRLRTLEHVAKLHDGASVPRLIQMLDQGPEPARHKVLWALTVITRQDFGPRPADWQPWWEDHRGEHRLQWMIAALEHDDIRLRKAAADELRREVREDFGYRADASPEERASATSRYRHWWDTVGAERFGRYA